ncbi:T9SS type A sorting domain-containing protein [uncultured Pontibacter sp.]|uniref:T9SS type A sorting domain-containing protein n=1 Tax=uncultured Pontibacter sp. TaxID=453356 RepID=UPI002618E91F|nr:T9SS type A sorting domain-containing protein [uncultured Pontibacter sp.]
MKRSIHATLLRNFLLTTLVAWVSLTAATAQTVTPGLIVQPATNSGELILDPNGDNYISVTASGFTGTADTGGGISEVPYRPIPTLATEPLGDVKNGTAGGHTDFAPPSPFQVYYTGTNLMFRLRVGGISTSRRGYSILIDSNNSFAGTGTNPGFEFEVLLSSNFGVSVIRHEGTSRQTVFSGVATQFSQKAVAASTGGGNPDYFYDFYVPITAFNNLISPSTPLRMVANTLNLAQSALIDAGNVVDVAGVDFRSYNQNAPAAWTDIISTFPPLTLNDIVINEIGQIRTFAPVISSPITTASTTITGTSREPAGTTITVLRNGTVIGNTTVLAGGTWTLTLAAGVTLAEGDQITATATAVGRPVSEASNTVIVIGTECVTAAPTFTIGAQGRSFSGSGALPNATIRVYRNGILLGTETANAGGSWTLRICPQGGTGTDGCIGTGEFTVTQQTSTTCESNPSAPAYYGLTNATPAPTISTAPVCVSTTTVSGTAAAGSFVTLFLNGRPINLVTSANNAYTVQAGTDGTWSLNANLGYEEGDELFVRARTATATYGQSTTATVTACQSEAPVITGEYCGTTTTVSGTSTEPEGTTVQIYVAGEPVGEPGVVNASGFWTVTGLEIPEGTTFTARATAPGNTESEDSEPVTATVQTPVEGLTINGPIQEGATSITGTGPAGAELTLYISGTPFTPIVIPPDGIWSLTGFARSEIFAGAEITATVTATDQCESTFADTVIVECLPLTTTFTVSSDSPDIICGGSGTVTVDLANSQLGVIYTLLVDGEESGAAVLGTGDALSLISGAINNEEAEEIEVTIAVRASRLTSGTDAPTSCTAVLNETLTRTVLPQPPTDYTVEPLSSNVCAGSSLTLQLSSSVSGYTYQLLNEATGELVGSSVPGTGTAINLSTGPLTTNATYSVFITNTANGCTFTDTARYTAVVAGPSIDRPVFALENSVCVGGTTTIFVSTEPNANYTYRVFRVDPNGVRLLLTSFTGNGNVIPVQSGALPINGTYTFSVDVTSPSCLTTQLLQTATVETTNNPSEATTGDDFRLCGDVAILTANSPSPGVGNWSVVQQPGGSPEVEIINRTSPSATANNLVSGVYIFEWTVTTTCGNSDPVVDSDQLTVTVNCDATYVIAPLKYRDEYVSGDPLATAVDPDGGIIAAVILAGTVPPGVDFDGITGNFTVGEPELLVTGRYALTIRLTDSLGDQTDLTITLVIQEDSPVIIPLPVELVYFTAYVRNNQAHLEWLTASEQDNDRFEIERSLDAKRFEKIGTVKGKGTTSLESKYQFVDRTPVQGTVYYRLKQVDLDGEFAYSNIIAVSADGLANNLVTQVYPNPFPDVLKVTLTAPQSQAATMTIYDLNGRRVMSKNVDLELGVNNMELQLQQLQSGMYILKIVGEGLESTTRIMKH